MPASSCRPRRGCWSGPARRPGRRGGSSRPRWSCARTASELAPVGGETVTIRVFSEPALMNWVGSSGASASEAKNRTPASATTRELGPAAAQDEPDDRRVAPDPDRADRLAGLVDLELDLVDQEVAEDRDDGQGADQRGQQRERHGQREGQEELRHQAADEAERQEDRDGRQRAGGDRAGDLLRPVDRGRQPILAERAVAIDVLEHDDRVIDHPPDGDREATQGQDVDRDAGDLHDHQRGQDRERDADRGDDRRPQAEQEQEDRR